MPSHLYSFSFAPNPEWTQTYSPQPEICDYLRRMRRRASASGRTSASTRAVESATWDDDAQRWEVETSRRARYARGSLIAGMGPLTEPRIPELPGLEHFEGETFHSARWNHDYDLAGKRVASIGTGASAIQYVPAIQKQVEQLHVFQRTAPWVCRTRTGRSPTASGALYRALPGAAEAHARRRLRRRASCSCSASSSSRG